MLNFERRAPARRACELAAALLDLLASQALPAQGLPPAVQDGFFIHFDVDGLRYEKSLYCAASSYDVIITPGESPGRHGLRLVSNALKRSPPAEGLQISVTDQFKLQDRMPVQSLPLTGAGMCNNPDNPDRPIVGEALYARAQPKTKRAYDLTNSWPAIPFISGDLDQERANTESIGFRTAEPTTLGSYSGVLEITRIDTAQQVIECRFRFKAFRDIVILKNTWGSYDGRCEHPEDFKIGTAEVSRGEFRMRYFHDPLQPSNSRHCPDGLSPDVPRRA